MLPKRLSMSTNLACGNHDLSADVAVYKISTGSSGLTSLPEIKLIPDTDVCAQSGKC